MAPGRESAALYRPAASAGSTKRGDRERGGCRAAWRSACGRRHAVGRPGGKIAFMTSFEKRNPADQSDVVWSGELSGPDEIVAAARVARVAQRGWAGVPAPSRGRVVAQVGRLVEANKEALAALVTREIGKPYAEALGEVQEVVDTCDFFLGEGRRLYGQTVPSEMPDKQLFTFRVPVGVVAVVTAGNFPTAVPSWYLVPALLCGNAVVWKPAETANAVAEALVGLFHAGGVPTEVLQLVAADGPSTFGRSAAGAGRWLRRQGRLHRVHRGRAQHRRAVRAAPADAVSGARRQEPDGGHARRRPRPRRRGGAVQRLRNCRAAVHLARDGVGAPERPRRVPATGSSPRSRRR